MSTVTPARPPRSVLRILLIAILVGAATTAMSLWWFEQPQAAGSALPNETVQVQAARVPVPEPLSHEIRTPDREHGAPAINSDRVASPLTERGMEVRAANMEDEPLGGPPEPAPVTTDTNDSDDSDDPEAGKTLEDSVTPDTKAATDAPAGNEDKAKPKPKPKAKAKEKAVNCKKTKCIALTFDDGPGPHTAKLLKILKKADVPATFFLLGRNVGVYPDVVETMSKHGHEIANHAWSHKDLTRLSKKKIAKELADTHKAIKKATGVAPELVRPPYGAVDKAVRKVLKGRGEPVILWDVDTEDWKNRNAKKATRAALKGAQNGSIILMHDIHSSTIDAVPGIIKGLRKEGYTFVTVSQLLGETTPGEVYYSR